MKVSSLLSLALGCLLFCRVPVAHAQTTTMVNNPADRFNIAPGGVDLRSGRYVYNATDLAVGGEGDGGLTLKRNMPDAVLNHYNSFGNFANNWDVMLVVYPWDTNGNGAPDDFQAVIHSSGLAATFESQHTWTNYAVKNPDGALKYLTYTGGARMGTSAVYTYTADDGTVIVFRPLGGYDCAATGSTQMCAFASSITKPDGTKYTLNYTATGDSQGNFVRLSSVVSSRGYAIVFEGATSGLSGYGSRITKTCVVNLSQTTLPSSCPSNAPQTATYNYNGLRLTGITAPDGQTSTIGYVTLSYGYQVQFTKPGQSTPWLTNTMAPNYNEEAVPVDVVSSQTFADGRTYTYSYSYTPNSMSLAGGGYTNSQGKSVSAPYDFPAVPGKGPGDNMTCTQFPCGEPGPDDFLNYVYQQTPGPVSITDELGRTTMFDYCDPIPMQQLPPYYMNRCFVVPLVSFTDPEGAKTYLTYSGRNVSGVRKVAKPGSGLPDIVTSATYDCSIPVNCAKPTTVTDAKGNVTTYTYDTTHGGILTETDPAVPVNGTGTLVSPVKRSAYVQRYAWISNGAGGYVHGSAPMWLLSTAKTCRTTATVGDACAGGAADEIVTAYDYGPDSGPNNLLLRGMTVTADVGGTITTLRTCYGYDALGNKISETKPRAGLTVCP